MRRAKEVAEDIDIIKYFRVKSANTEVDVASFSGGNQQTVLIAKWLIGDPKVVILDEPSRGADVGGRQRIHEAIAELAARGVAVLVISVIEEVVGLCHRAYQIDRGRIVEEVDPALTDDGAVLATIFRRQSTPDPSCA